MYSGGQGVYLYYLSREFQRLGHEVDVLVGPPYPHIAEGIRVHRIKNLNFFESGNHFLPTKNPFQVFTPLNFYELAMTRLWMFPEMFSFGIRAYLKVRELITQHRFDIIHDNQTLAYGILLIKTLKVPVVATVHHPLPIDRQSDLAQLKSLRERLRRIMFYPFFMQHIVTKRMDRVITVSRSSAEETKGIFKVPEDKLRVVYHGIDANLFRKRGDVRKESNSLIVVANTRDRKKGIRYLLEALLLLKGEVKLTIVDSEAPDNEYAPGLVKEYGLEEMVTFTGHLSAEELARRYSAAEIAVTPSTYEGFGFPTAEAMACGIPVVATTAGALPEIVKDGQTGILVPPGVPYALASAIKLLLSDEPLRRRMGEAGRERVKRCFTWEQAAKATLEVYQEVL